MTTKDLIDTLYEKKQFLSLGGKYTGSGVLMPFFLMDIAYQVYCKDIKTVPMRYQLSRLRKQWSDEYHKFNMWFFSVFDKDQETAVMDYMDDLTAATEKEIAALRTKLEDCLQPVEENLRKTCVSGELCLIITYAAQVFWLKYYQPVGIKKNNYQLEQMVLTMRRLMAIFSSGIHEQLSFNDSDDVNNAVTDLCTAIVKWASGK